MVETYYDDSQEYLENISDDTPIAYIEGNSFINKDEFFAKMAKKNEGILMITDFLPDESVIYYTMKVSRPVESAFKKNRSSKKKKSTQRKKRSVKKTSKRKPRRFYN